MSKVLFKRGLAACGCDESTLTFHSAKDDSKRLVQKGFGPANSVRPILRVCGRAGGCRQKGSGHPEGSEGKHDRMPEG